MALPNLVQFEEGRVITITWTKQGTTTPESLMGKTLSGRIETIPGPEYAVRQVEGSLAVVADGEITWTVDPLDSTYDGEFSIQFIATNGSTRLLSIPTPLKVIRSIEWP